MRPQHDIKELTVLNIIMLVAVVLGLAFGFLIDNVLGGAALGMFVGFAGRIVYLRKKYRELNPKEKGEKDE